MMEAQRLHGHLIGQQGSRRSLNTPALVLEVDMLDRNIAEMASFAKAHGMKLRPHSKTHKSADIAKRQIAAGALASAAPSWARPKRWARPASRPCTSPRQW